MSPHNLLIGYMSSSYVLTELELHVFMQPANIVRMYCCVTAYLSMFLLLQLWMALVQHASSSDLDVPCTQCQILLCWEWT